MRFSPPVPFDEGGKRNNGPDMQTVKSEQPVMAERHWRGLFLQILLQKLPISSERS